MKEEGDENRFQGTLFAPLLFASAEEEEEEEEGHAQRTKFEPEERRLGTRSKDYTNPVPVGQSHPPSPLSSHNLSSVVRQRGRLAGCLPDLGMDGRGQLIRNGRFFTSRWTEEKKR